MKRILSTIIGTLVLALAVARCSPIASSVDKVSLRSVNGGGGQVGIRSTVDLLSVSTRLTTEIVERKRISLASLRDESAIRISANEDSEQLAKFKRDGRIELERPELGTGDWTAQFLIDLRGKTIDSEERRQFQVKLEKAGEGVWALTIPESQMQDRVSHEIREALVAIVLKPTSSSR